MNRERAWLLKEKYGGKECPEFFEDLERLKSGEPLAYVIGWVDFLGCRIDLSRRPLIPRPETEWWVEKAISRESQAAKKAIRVLDLFSGSGCIGIALAKHLPDAQVDCADIGKKYIEQIAINARLNGVSRRVRPIVSDVFSNITGTYDLILANPPYIPLKLKETLDVSVTRYEPSEALFAENGVSFINTLIEQSRDYLNPGGIVYVEFGADQKREIEMRLQHSHWDSELWKDQYGRWRVLILTTREK